MEAKMLKTNISKLILLLLISVIITGCLNTNPDDGEGVRSIQLDILMDVEFNRLSIRESGSSNPIITQYGQFHKGSHIIKLNLTLNDYTRYDIQLHTADGTTATKTNVLLSQNAIVEFDISDLDDDTAKEITVINVLNRTGIDFGHVRFSITGSSSWFFTKDGQIENNIAYTISNITPPLSTTTRYDIQLRDHATGNIRATRTNILLSQNRTVLFTENNID